MDYTHLWCKLYNMGKLVRNQRKTYLIDNQQAVVKNEKVDSYFLRYITSFTSFTVRGTSGNAAATRLEA